MMVLNKQNLFFTDMIRKGITIPEFNHGSICYLPQYDTTWCPVPIEYDMDNKPALNDSKESKLRYLCTYEPEFGHRIINFRTIVGSIHITFTMLKIVQLFYMFLNLGDSNYVRNNLCRIDSNARAFFNDTTIWDETFSLMHTKSFAKLFGLTDFADKYEIFTLSQYPFIKKSYKSLVYIFDNVKSDNEKKSYLINAIFNEAATIDPFSVLDNYASGNNKTPCLKQNVDARFLMMLEFCENTLRKNDKLTAEQLGSQLFHYMKEIGIAIDGVKYTKDDLEELFEDIGEEYIDGLIFKLMYRTIWKQLLRDMKKLRTKWIPYDEDSFYPVSAVTIRPGLDGKTKWPIFRESLGLSNEKHNLYPFEINVELNKSSCFFNLFILGETVEAVIKGKEAPICNSGLHHCTCQSLTNCYLGKVMLAFQGKFDSKTLFEEFTSSIRF